jgi:predicted ester cyclase
MNPRKIEPAGGVYMSKFEIIRKAYQALEEGDFAAAEPYFADDFTYRGTLEKSYNKREYFELMTALKQGFPDYSLNLRFLSAEGDAVKTVFDAIGTHTGIFQIPGITPIQPTGKVVALPRHMMTFILNGEKIREARLEDVSGGGMSGLLEFLDVQLPSSSG